MKPRILHVRSAPRVVSSVGVGQGVPVAEESALARRPRTLTIGLLVLLALGLIPVFQFNLTQPGDAFYFSNWDIHSQALVLGKIEQDVVGTSHVPVGLAVANPDPLSPYATFDALQVGARPTATSYSQYASSIGLQGFAFEGLYNAGCSTVLCLNSVESGVYSFVFVLFAVMLGVVVRRSLAIVFLVSSLVSPWIVSSAHNLYWVPWSWLLPAIAACALVAARQRRWRIVWYVAIGLATALKASMGYEYLTATTVLAASIPVLAHILGIRRSWRAVGTSAAIIGAACVVGFVVTLLIHAAIVGGGSVPNGLAFVIHDAQRRTYGSASLDNDPLVSASLHASVIAVLARYVAGWSTAIYGVGVNGPFTAVSIGAGGFWIMVLIGGAIVAFDLLAGRGRWRRNAIVFGATAAAPLSWFILAKSHSFTETNENYVLWYLIFLPALVWIIADAVVTSSRTRWAHLLGSLGPLAGERSREDKSSMEHQGRR